MVLAVQHAVPGMIMVCVGVVYAASCKLIPVTFLAIFLKHFVVALNASAVVVHQRDSLLSTSS